MKCDGCTFDFPDSDIKPVTDEHGNVIGHSCSEICSTWIINGVTVKDLGGCA